MPTIDSHFLPGSGDTLVVTFNEMWNHYKNQRFWGEDALRKAGFPAFGITSDGPHWYPTHETVRAMRTAVKVARNYTNVVLYGYSMGAHAAIKYSWLFNNPHVIAFSPQWSIDPSDLGGMDHRYDDFFVSSNRDVKIEREDIWGRVHVVYDPLYEADAVHVARLEGNIFRIPLHYCGHETIHSVNGSGSLRGLIEAVVSHDVGTMRELLRKGRRKNSYYAKYILKKMIERSHNKAAFRFASASFELGALREPEALAMAADASRHVGEITKAIFYYNEANRLTGDPKYATWASDLEHQAAALQGEVNGKKRSNLLKRLFQIS